MEVTTVDPPTCVKITLLPTSELVVTVRGISAGEDTAAPAARDVVNTDDCASDVVVTIESTGTVAVTVRADRDDVVMAEPTANAVVVTVCPVKVVVVTVGRATSTLLVSFKLDNRFAVVTTVLAS